MRLWAYIAGILLVAACSPKPRASEVALQDEISNLRWQLDQYRAAPKPPPALAPEPGFTLVVSWPDGLTEGYQHSYPSEARCELARKAVFEENARREAEAQAKVGTMVGENARLIVAASPPKASAVCVPA